jgi:outer membrane lipoprotein-sorting protein
MSTSPEYDLEKKLARLAAIEPNPQEARRAILRAERTLESTAGRSGRHAMRLRLAAAVVFLVAAGLFFVAWGKSTPLALASFQHNVAKSQSLSAARTSYLAGKPTDKGTLRLLKEGLVRFDDASGNYSVMDMKKRKLLMVNVRSKQATLLHNAAPRAPMDLYDHVRKLSEKATRALGERDIAGKPAAGFLVALETDCGQVEMTLWVDVATRLPVRIEYSSRDEHNQQVQEIIDHIVFDSPIDRAVFRLEPPAGFRLVEQGVSRPLPAAPKETLELVLTPGVGLGPVKFGMSKKEVLDALGEPDTIDRNTSLNYLSRGYSFIVSPQRGLMVIQCYSQPTFLAKVTDFAGKTAENIKVGATRKEIENAYGIADAIEVRNASTVNMEYRNKGISFLLFNDKLVQIWAHR